jgi:hypothetical protein
MGKRFAIVIAVAAAGVMTLGAQTAAAAPVYDTKVTIRQDRSPPNTFLHGDVTSAVRKCEVRRRVILFKQQPGPDRILGATRSDGQGEWSRYVRQAKTGWHVYARVTRAVRPAIGLVCRRDRSPIHVI